MQRTVDKKSPSRLVDLIRSMGEGGGRSYFAFRSDFCTTRWSYRKILDLSMRFSSLLKECNIGKGDKVIIWGDNSLPMLVALLGTINHGAVVVPLDGTIVHDTALRIAKKVQVKLVVSSNENRKFRDTFPFLSLDTLEEKLSAYPVKSAESPMVYESDPAEIVFTSGITAEPKGVIIRHSNITSLFAPISEILSSMRPALRILRNINFLALLPLSHLYGQMVEVFVPLMIKGSVVFPQKLSSFFLLETIKKEKITIAVCVPRILEILKLYIINDIRRRGKEKAFWKKYERAAGWHFFLRFLYFFGLHHRIGLKFLAVAVGGAKLAPEIYEFYRRLSIAVFQGYGLTETSPIVTIFNPLRDKQGSVGKVVGNQEIRIADDGEILVKGANVSEGYFGDQDMTEASFQEGWFRTGDIGDIDRDGNLYFLGRKKDVIVTSDGINVYPQEIERVLNLQAGVKDSAVIGVNIGGREEVMAVLRVWPGVGSGEEIVRAANAILPPSQRIKQFCIWPEADFPRTSLLKINKREVAKRIASLKTSTPPPSGAGLFAAISRLTNMDVGALHSSLKLGDDLGLSSLDRLELAVSLENDYQIAIQDSFLDEKTSIRDLENLLSGRQRGREITMPHFSNHPVFICLRFLAWHIILFPLLRILCRSKVIGLENLQGVDPPAIFVANHASHLDTPLILRSLPPRFRYRISPAMTIDLFREYFFPTGLHPFLRLFQFAGYIILVVFFHTYPFSPAAFRRSFSYTGELIEKNYSPLVFPEGERTYTGEIEPFKEGIGHLALGIRVPIIPLRLKGTFRVLPRYTFVPKRGDVSVHIGKPYLFKRGEPKSVANTLRKIIKEL